MRCAGPATTNGTPRYVVLAVVPARGIRGETCGRTWRDRGACRRPGDHEDGREGAWDRGLRRPGACVTGGMHGAARGAGRAPRGQAEDVGPEMGADRRRRGTRRRHVGVRADAHSMSVRRCHGVHRRPRVRQERSARCRWPRRSRLKTAAVARTGPRHRNTSPDGPYGHRSEGRTRWPAPFS